MSATIPNGMLLSDLLKATGYDCPDDLQGKTFSQATSGGEADLEANHASTVDVGEYTQPIEITPAEGKDGMEKVTLTLTNIPSEADLDANKTATIDVSTYTEPVEITPTEGKDGMAKVTVTLSNIPSSGGSYKDVESESNITVPCIFKVVFTDNTESEAFTVAGTYNEDGDDKTIVAYQDDSLNTVSLEMDMGSTWGSLKDNATSLYNRLHSTSKIGSKVIVFQ